MTGRTASSGRGRARRAGLLALLALGLAACGAQRTPPPSALAPLAPGGTRALAVPQVGLALRVPRRWTDLPPRDALAAGVESRGAVLAVWRYPRAEPLPQGAAALRRAQRRLLASVRRRDPSLRIRRARLTTVGGAPAIELIGRQAVAGQPVAFRSTHLFAAGAELVVDAHAPVAAFPRVDAEVFAPVTRSLRLVAAGG